MRMCIRCQCQMIEGFDVKVERAVFGITVAKGTGILAKRLGKPKVAICPKCGEISLYMPGENEL